MQKKWLISYENNNKLRETNICKKAKYKKKNKKSKGKVNKKNTNDKEKKNNDKEKKRELMKLS